MPPELDPELPLEPVELPTAPELPELPELPVPPELPEVPELPELPELVAPPDEEASSEPNVLPEPPPSEDPDWPEDPQLTRTPRTNPHPAQTPRLIALSLDQDLNSVAARPKTDHEWSVCDEFLHGRRENRGRTIAVIVFGLGGDEVSRVAGSRSSRRGRADATSLAGRNDDDVS
jgi:hypothetical protein